MYNFWTISMESFFPTSTRLFFVDLSQSISDRPLSTQFLVDLAWLFLVNLGWDYFWSTSVGTILGRLQPRLFLAKLIQIYFRPISTMTIFNLPQPGQFLDELDKVYVRPLLARIIFLPISAKVVFFQPQTRLCSISTSSKSIFG